MRSETSCFIPTQLLMRSREAAFRRVADDANAEKLEILKRKMKSSRPTIRHIRDYYYRLMESLNNARITLPPFPNSRSRKDVLLGWFYDNWDQIESYLPQL